MNKVVCAAIKYKETGIIIPCVRHYDKYALRLEDLLSVILYGRNHNFSLNDTECGFLDNKGNFLTRSEAYNLVKENGQEFIGNDYKLNGVNSLITENLY